MIGPLGRTRVGRSLLLGWVAVVLAGSLATWQLPGPPLARSLERLLSRIGR